MIKIRSKKIALLLVMAMLVMMFASVATAGATSSDNGIVTVSKSINQNVQEDEGQSLGWTKVAIDSADRVAGNLYVEFTLPDGVEFDAESADKAPGTVSVNGAGYVDADNVPAVEDEDTTWTVKVPVTATTPTDTADYYATIKLPTVTVDDSAADSINVGVTVDYVDSNDNSVIDSFDSSLLLGKKGDQNVAVTAADPVTVSLGTNKDVADITLKEDFVGSMEEGSRVSFTLPDGYTWSDATVDAGRYGLDGTCNTIVNGVESGTLNVNDDGDVLYLTITSPSSALADKLKIESIVNVKPDADQGDVKVAVEDDSVKLADGTTPDSNVDDADVVVANYGDSDVTVTADKDSVDTDYSYRATEGNVLYDITLESSGTFTAGDDLLLTLPDGVQFMDSMNDPATFADGKLTNNGTYSSDKGLWLTVAADAGDKIVIKDLEVGITPTAATGDLAVKLGGDVTTASVVAGQIVDKATVTAAKANVQVGLDAAAGDITLVENKDDALTTDDVIYLTLPSGVSFSSDPTVKVNGDEVEDAADTSVSNDNDVCAISLADADLNGNDPDTIVISGIKYDIDNRYTAGKEIAVKIGGKDAVNDTLNGLGDIEGDALVADCQFEDEADDAVYTVANAVVGSANAANVVFTIGANTYTNNGVTSNMDVAPFIQNNRTYVPVRYIANALGISDQNIIWDAANQTVTLLKGDKVVQFKIGSTTRIINGISTTMDVAPTIVNNRTFLPARFVAEAFGANVAWDAAAPTLVNITVK